MKLQPIADDLISWCKNQRIDHEIVRYQKSAPSPAQLKKLSRLHPALPNLYEDTNGIIIAWGQEGQEEECGLLKIHEIDECIDLAESEAKGIAAWSDLDILASGHDAAWWKPRIPLYRSLMKFYDEGNGDCIAVSKLDSAVYFVFGSWMDLGGDQPPIMKLADDLHSLITHWSAIRFACPKNLYWMSAVSSGQFTGFNEVGFALSSAR